MKANLHKRSTNERVTSLEDGEFVDLTLSDNDEIEDQATEGDDAQSPFWPAIEVEGNILGPAEYAILKHGNWFNDELINGYMNFLVQNTDEGTTKTKTLTAVSSFLFPQLLRSGRDESRKTLARYFKHFNFKQLEIVLMPINQDGAHWILVEWLVQEGCMKLLDSLSIGKFKRNKRLLGQLSSFVNSYLESNVSIEDLLKDLSIADGSRAAPPMIVKLEVAQNVPQQSDGSSCGAFTCKFAYNVINRLDQEPFDLDVFRQQMIQDFLSVKIKPRVHRH